MVQEEAERILMDHRPDMPRSAEMKKLQAAIDTVLFNRELKDAEWDDVHIISCSALLRQSQNIVEHKCTHCNRYSIQFAGQIISNFCSHCGSKIGEKT